MDKTILAVARPENTLIYLLSGGEIIESKECFGSFAEAAKAIKLFIQRYRLPREVYLLLEAEAQYFHFVSESIRSKKEIAVQLNLKESELWGYSEYFAERYIYHVLSYKQETLNPYLQQLKKQELLCKAAVPFDFLALRSGLNGVFMTHIGEEIFFKIFDGYGNYYVKKFRNENQFLQHRQKILMYLKREKIVQLPDHLPERFKDLEPAELIKDFPRLFSNNWSVYSEKKVAVPKRKVILQTKHKVLIGLLIVIFSIVAAIYLYQFIQICLAKSDIKKLQKQLSAIAPQAQRLKEQEENTRYFKILNERRDPLLRLTALAKGNALNILSLLQVDRQKPLALVAVGQVQDRDKFIKDLQKAKEFRSVNLIYARFNGLLVEFKLILAER